MTFVIKGKAGKNRCPSYHSEAGEINATVRNLGFVLKFTLPLFYNLFHFMCVGVRVWDPLEPQLTVVSCHVMSQTHRNGLRLRTS